MNEPSIVLLCIVASYLLGAIPFGLLIGFACGKDIRKLGSGNIGATNVLRTVGKSLGALALICDALKGFVSAFLLPMIGQRWLGAPLSEGVTLACACAAIAGHNWPVYLKFKGGKGIATTAGALLGIAPAALGVGLAAWVCTFLASRYVSLASIVAAAAIPISAWLFYIERGMLTPIVLSILGVVAIIRHRANIARLVHGNENRISFKKGRP